MLLVETPDDDLVVIEGDILVTKEQAVIYYESGWDGLVKSEAWDRGGRRWNTNIPYKIPKSIKNSKDRKVNAIYNNILESLDDIQRHTCITFKEKGCFDSKYIYFVLGDG